MDIGIGLPATVPGVDRAALLEWARRAEARGFSSLGVLDRIVYPNYEPLIALAAAAAVTERIRLMTDILIVPYRTNAALLAKQALTLDHLSNGRLVLGMAIGARPDDYEASGVEFKDRGRRFDAQLEELRRIWSGEQRGYAGPIGPPALREGGPPILIGGTADPAVRRTVAFGDGWTMGGGRVEDFRRIADHVRAAWREGARQGEPRLAMLVYYALGERARAAADWYLKDYYGFAPSYAELVAAGASVSETAVREVASGLRDAGCDEVVFFPCSTDPRQVDLLADAVLTA